MPEASKISSVKHRASSRGKLKVARGMLCPFREYSCAVEGAPETGTGPTRKDGREREAGQRGANLPTASARPFLLSRPLSGDGSVDVVKHELFAHRVEGAEILYCCCPGGGLLTQRCGEAESAERKIETMTENETTRSTQ